MAIYQFGAVGNTNLAEGTYGLLQGFSKSVDGDEQVAKDANGNVADATLYNDTQEITPEYLYDTETTPPSRGDTIIVGTDSHAVVNVEEVESNEDYTRLNLTLKRYTSNGVAPGT